MALRVLEYATMTWRQAWKKQVGRNKQLHGILPIIFYTGHDSWSQHRQLEDLICAAQPCMCPYWPIAYFCVDEFDPAELTANPGPFINALAIVRVEKSEEIDHLESTLTQIVRRIASLSMTDHDRFMSLMEFVIKWISARLPKSAQPSLLETSYVQVRYSDREDFMTMTNKLGISWEEEAILARKKGEESGYAKGRAEGRTEGRTEGQTEARTEGKTEALRANLLQLLQAKFGGVPVMLGRRVEDCTDLDALQRACVQVLDANAATDIEL